MASESPPVVPYKEETNLHFNSKAYLQRYTNPYEPSLPYHLAFLKSWHSFYKEHGQTLETAATMLEYGGGPTVWDLISAAPFVSSILFTDFAISNRAEIKLWKENNSECHNWRPYIEHVVKVLEGNNDPKAVDVREQEVRDKIARVAPCDARADKPLGDIQEKFDIIHSVLCLESVAEDMEAFYRYFNNMCQYLKEGGYLVLGTACECPGYRCWAGEETLHVIFLKPEDIQEACRRAGLTEVSASVVSNSEDNKSANTKYYRFTVAQKTKKTN